MFNILLCLNSKESVVKISEFFWTIRGMRLIPISFFISSYRNCNQVGNIGLGLQHLYTCAVSDEYSLVSSVSRSFKFIIGLLMNWKYLFHYS